MGLLVFGKKKPTLWTKNQAIAQLGGGELGPMQFVEMFVAANVEGA